MYIPDRSGSSTITEQLQNLMIAFWNVVVEISEYGCLRNRSLWISFVTSTQRRKLDGSRTKKTGMSLETKS